MRRREFLSATSAVLTWPVVAVAQSDRVRRIAIMNTNAEDDPEGQARIVAFRRGLQELGHAVSDALSRNFLDVDVETGVGNGRLLAYLAAHGEVLSKNFTNSRMTVHCRIPQQLLGAINEEGTEVRPHRNGYAM